MNIHFALTDASGAVVAVGNCSPDDLFLQAPPEGGARIVLTEDTAPAIRAAMHRWRLIDGMLVERADAGAPSLAIAKAVALQQVDRAAETARLRFLTPGSGQALEYQATEVEARAYAAAGYLEFDPETYPFLQAERLAVQAATGALPEAQATAQAVIAQADAWRQAGSAIKAFRRAAKLRIEAATAQAEIQAALQITWPTP